MREDSSSRQWRRFSPAEAGTSPPLLFTYSLPRALLRRRCYVATEPSLRQAMALGMERVRLYGLPIRPAFARALPPQGVLRK